MRFASAVGVALMALVIGACGGGDDESGGGGGEGGTIKVGAWFPLVRPRRCLGDPAEGGRQRLLRAGQRGRAGSTATRSSTSTEDNAFDPQQTIQAARKLVGDEKVVAIVSANGTATSAAAFPYVLNQAKVPIINTYGGAGRLVQPARGLCSSATRPCTSSRAPQPARGLPRTATRTSSWSGAILLPSGPWRSTSGRARSRSTRASTSASRSSSSRRAITARSSASSRARIRTPWS